MVSGWHLLVGWVEIEQKLAWLDTTTPLPFRQFEILVKNSAPFIVSP